MKKQTLIFSSIFLILSALFFNACKKIDDPKPVEQELITTVKLVLIDNFLTNEYYYKVSNGFGGNGTVEFDTISIEPNKSYIASVYILNESVTPVEDVTEEIIDENLDHLLVWEYTPETGGVLTFTNGNKDDNQMPLNLTGELNTAAAGVGELTITLKHLPTNKNATQADAAGGNTDAQAVFPVRVQ